jgi:porin
VPVQCVFQATLQFELDGFARITYPLRQTPTTLYNWSGQTVHGEKFSARVDGYGGCVIGRFMGSSHTKMPAPKDGVRRSPPKTAQRDGQRWGHVVKSMPRQYFLSLAFAVMMVVPAFAEQPDTQGESWFVDATDITPNPDDITNRLAEEAQPKDSLLRTPQFDTTRLSWKEFKDRLYEDYGFGFGIFYTTLYQKADASLVDAEGKSGPDEAAGGILGIAGIWELVGRDTQHPGSLGFRLQQRHKMSSIDPQSLGPDIGSLWLTGSAFNEFEMSLIELYWEQHIVKDRLAFRVGKNLPFVIHDYFSHKSPVTDFQDSNFTLNSSIAWTGFAMGAVGLVRPSPDIYILGGIYDAKGKQNRAGIDSFFNDGEHLILTDIGWDPGFLDPSRKVRVGPIEVSNYHVTLWHRDSVDQAMTPEGWGFTLFLEHRIGNFVPFFRYGYADGIGGSNPALLDHMVAGGVALEDVFGQDNDVIGIGASWGRRDLGTTVVPVSEPVIVSVGDELIDLGEFTDLLDVDFGTVEQYSVELFYRVQVTQEFQVTPSVQFIIDPAFNLAEDNIAVLGVRGRAEF